MDWNQIGLVATLLGGLAAIGYFWEKIVAFLKRERVIRQHVKKVEGLDKALSFTNAAKPPDHKEPPLDAGEIWGATQSGRTPFFVNAPFTDLALAKRESQRAGKKLFLVVYDAEHSRQSQIRYLLGCALDLMPLKQIMDKSFVVCLTPMQMPGIAKLVPDGSWMEAALMYVFEPDGTLQWRTEIYANSKMMKQYLDDIQAGKKRIEAPTGAKEDALAAT